MEHPPSDYDSTRTNIYIYINSIITYNNTYIYIYTHKYIKWLSHQGKLFISPRIGWRENLKETPNMIFLLWLKTQSFLWIHCRFSLKPNEFLSAMLDEPRMPRALEQQPSGCYRSRSHGGFAPGGNVVDGNPTRAMDRVTSLWPLKLPEIMVTLWLCQNSYWKWQFIVDFPIKHGDFP